MLVGELLVFRSTGEIPVANLVNDNVGSLENVFQVCPCLNLPSTPAEAMASVSSHGVKPAFVSSVEQQVARRNVAPVGQGLDERRRERSASA